MLDIKTIKQNIENKDISDTLIVFKYGDCNFLAEQYIKEIVTIKNIEIEYVDNLQSIVSDAVDIFGFNTSTTNNHLRLHRCDVLDYTQTTNKSLLDEKNLIICCSKFKSKDIEKYFEPYTVVCPILEDWQIKDWVYSVCKGVDTKGLDKLITLCGKDLNRLHMEVDKLALFSEVERKYLWNDFESDGVFSDLSSYNIFNLSNALATKDYNTVLSIYKEIDKCDITDMYLLTVLYNTFKKITMVQLTANPTEQNTGIPQKQLWAVKKQCGFYSTEQLNNIMNFLTNIDYKIKCGEMPMNILVEYLILNVIQLGKQ